MPTLREQYRKSVACTLGTYEKSRFWQSFKNESNASIKLDILKNFCRKYIDELIIDIDFCQKLANHSVIKGYNFILDYLIVEFNNTIEPLWDIGDELLNISIERNNGNMLLFLLSKGADKNSLSVDSYGKILRYMVSNGEYKNFIEVVKTLDNFSDYFFSISEELLILAAETNDKTDILKFLIEENANIIETNECKNILHLIIGNTKLSEYIRLSDSIFLKSLLMRGLDIDFQDQNGNTALHYAALFNYNYIELLVNNGANPNIINKHSKLAIDKISRDYDHESGAVDLAVDVLNKSMVNRWKSEASVVNCMYGAETNFCKLEIPKDIRSIIKYYACHYFYVDSNGNTSFHRAIMDVNIQDFKNSFSFYVDVRKHNKNGQLAIELLPENVSEEVKNEVTETFNEYYNNRCVLELRIIENLGYQWSKFFTDNEIYDDIKSIIINYLKLDNLEGVNLNDSLTYFGISAFSICDQKTLANLIVKLYMISEQVDTNIFISDDEVNFVCKSKEYAYSTSVRQYISKYIINNSELKDIILSDGVIEDEEVISNVYNYIESGQLKVQEEMKEELEGFVLLDTYNTSNREALMEKLSMYCMYGVIELLLVGDINDSQAEQLWSDYAKESFLYEQFSTLD